MNASYLPLTSSPSGTSNTSSPPAWAFKGAIANYTVVTFENGISVYFYQNYTITGLFESNQTYLLSYHENRSYLPPSVIDGYHSYLGPAGLFPAYNSSELSMLKEGDSPFEPAATGISNFTMNRESLTLPSGTYSSYHITYTEILSIPMVVPVKFNTSLWVDTSSGLFLKTDISELSSNASNSYINSSLTYTNIIKPGNQNLLYYAVGIIAAVVAAILIVLYYTGRQRDRSSKKSAPIEQEQPPHRETAAIKARKDELKDLLERGVISQEYYDRSIEVLSKGGIPENEK